MTLLTVGAAAQTVLVMCMTSPSLTGRNVGSFMRTHMDIELPAGTPTPLPDVELLMSCRMRGGVEAAGGRPDDLRAQHGQACVRYHLRRYAIERGYRPRRLSERSR